MALCNGIYWSVIFSCLLICCCVKPVFSQTTETTSLPQPTWETQTQGSETTGKIPLYLGGFFSLAGSAFDASGSLVSVRMALEDINARPDVLSDYELRMVWSNTMCNAGLGTRRLFELIQQPPQKLMLIGPACSTTAQAVAQTAFYWNLITISYSVGSPALSNRLVFPKFFRTYMPDTLLNKARLHIIRDFGWKRVATIHENEDLFSLSIDDMVNLLKTEDIDLISSESFDEDPINQIANLKQLDARIILVNMYEDKARRVFCEAWRQNMTGPGYVWLLLGWYSMQWWTVRDDSITRCTTEEIKNAVEGSLYIATECAVFGRQDADTVSGVTPLDFDVEIQRRLLRQENENHTYSGQESFGYDAVWAIALALNKSAEVLKTKRFRDGSIRRLEDFTYDDKEMSQLFFDLLAETDFYGTSGPVSFIGSDRIAVTKVEQMRVGCPIKWVQKNGSCFLFVELQRTGDEAAIYCRENHNSQLAVVSSKAQLDVLLATLQELDYTTTEWLLGQEASNACSVLALNGWAINPINCTVPLSFVCEVDAEYTEVSVGLYETATDVLVMEMDFKWPDGEVPLDRTLVFIQTRVEVYRGINRIVFIAFSSVAGVGILLSLFFLGFNVRYRKLRIVRMSSPNLNNIILIGTSLVYASVVIFGIDENLVDDELFLVFCHVRVWLLSVGFVLAFGGMFSKTWRVHKVVAMKTPKRVVVQDRQLYAIVAFLLLVDVAILVPWQILFPWRVERTYLPEMTNPRNSSELLEPYIEFCTSDYYVYWSAGLSSVKGLLLVFGAFLAWETRQVTIPLLNDSKLIGMSVYNVVILCIVGLAVNLVLGQDPETLFIFNSCISMFCTTLTILIVFLPKVLAVSKSSKDDPTAQDLGRVSTVYSTTPDANRTTMIQDNLKLKVKIKLLEDQLKHLKGPTGKNASPNGRTLANGGSKGKVRTRACNCGLWCCGLICGYSPEEILPPEGEGAGRYTHTNDVDLSLETTAAL
ncbi:uncharacterized protein LOC117290084 [Asterias rubens]|uniref:uncharacterized protein LOC117290084 n=1 Tax=Asterias rubens TaxID=7604 RepID=UPI0014558D15|nr:uncharacterized protein LOC117290084 [Asterias rubens]